MFSWHHILCHFRLTTHVITQESVTVTSSADVHSFTLVHFVKRASAGTVVYGMEILVHARVALQVHNWENSWTFIKIHEIWWKKAPKFLQISWIFMNIHENSRTWWTLMNKVIHKKMGHFNMMNFHEVSWIFIKTHQSDQLWLIVHEPLAWVNIWIQYISNPVWHQTRVVISLTFATWGYDLTLYANMSHCTLLGKTRVPVISPKSQ